MTREDMLALCEEAIADLEYNDAEDTVAWNNFIEIRAYLVNQGD